MRVLLQNPLPFALAHGGMQIQIEQTKAALEKVGVEVEYLRWWDDRQTGDVLHHFGRIPQFLLKQAQNKGMKVVIADLLTAQGSRSPARLAVQSCIIQAMKTALPGALLANFNWDSYRLADACVALTPHEAHLIHQLFGAPREKIHVVPNGVEEVFLQSRPAERGSWLVCTATITERKRVLELAEAAVAAQTPVWIIGRAYNDSDTYARRFFELAKMHPKIVRFEGPVGDREKLAGIYRAARGFVLLSAMESLSLSALEAAACECPLLLSDLPWARTVFADTVSYCSVTTGAAAAGKVLRRFYDAAPALKPPAKPMNWVQVAGQLKAVYARLPGKGALASSTSR